MSIDKTSSYFLRRQEPLDKKAWLDIQGMNSLVLSDRYPWMLVVEKTSGQLYQLQPVAIPSTADLVNDWTFKPFSTGGGTSNYQNVIWTNGIPYQIGYVVFFGEKIYISKTINIDKAPVVNGILDTVNWYESGISLYSHPKNQDLRLGRSWNFISAVGYTPAGNSMQGLDIRNYYKTVNTCQLSIKDSASFGSLVIDNSNGINLEDITVNDFLIVFNFYNGVDVNTPPATTKTITFKDILNVSNTDIFPMFLGGKDITFSSDDGAFGQFIHFKLDIYNRIYLYNSSKKDITATVISSDLKPVLAILPDLSNFPTNEIGDRYIVANSIYEKYPNSSTYTKVLDASLLELGQAVVVQTNPASWYIWNGSSWNKDAAYDPSKIDNIVDYFNGNNHTYKRFTEELVADPTGESSEKIIVPTYISDGITKHLTDIKTYYSDCAIDSPNTNQDGDKVTIYKVLRYDNIELVNNENYRMVTAFVPSDKKVYMMIYDITNSNKYLDWTQIYPMSVNSIAEFNLGDFINKNNFILSIDETSNKIIAKDFSYTDIVPLEDDFQGMSKNQTFNKIPISTMIHDIIHKYYKPVATFLCGIPTYNELGSQFPTETLFTWIYQNSQNILIDAVSGMHIEILDSTNGGAILFTTDNANSSELVALQNLTIPQVQVFRLQCYDIKGNLITKDITIYGVNPIYYGASNLESLADTDILLMIKTLINNWKTTYPIADSGYKYINIPVSTGTPVAFKDADTGFAIDMQSPIVITVNGIDYNSYRSTNILHSSVNIIVS